ASSTRSKASSRPTSMAWSSAFSFSARSSVTMASAPSKSSRMRGSMRSWGSSSAMTILDARRAVEGEAELPRLEQGRRHDLEISGDLQLESRLREDVALQVDAGRDFRHSHAVLGE